MKHGGQDWIGAMQAGLMMGQRNIQLEIPETLVVGRTQCLESGIMASQIKNKTNTMSFVLPLILLVSNLTPWKFSVVKCDTRY